jgi:thiopurine S-methyltransferase
MEIEFWKQRWDNNQIGFHQQKINPYLAYFYGEKGPERSARTALKVFVPLCGKSMDLLWLAQNGYETFGVECSETAVRSFFEENSVNYKSAENEHGSLFMSPATDAGRAGIEIFQGDFFALGNEELSTVTDVYDRAAFVAMPEDMRVQYAEKMTQLLSPGTRMLLVTLTYDPAEMNGPPFSVTEENVRELYSDNFTVEKLCYKNVIDDEPGLKQRGLGELTETVYKLVRN